MPKKTGKKLNQMTDKELIRMLNHADLHGSTPHYIHRELTRRAILQTNKNTAHLKEAIDHLSQNSDSYSAKIAVLTWVLIVLSLLSLTFPVLSSWKF